MNLSKLYEPVNYIIDEGGKNIRGLIIKYIQNLLNNDNNIYTKFFIEDTNTAHNISLIIDDIQDDSKLRRGKPSAHIIYGVPLTINSAYLKCFSLLTSVNENYGSIASSIKDIYLNCIEKSHIGQGLDILWTKEKYIPTIEEYLYMIDNKTGIVFNCAAQLCLASLTTDNVNKDLVFELTQNIGRFFQIRDDYINFTNPEYWRLKGFCTDLDEKKLSYIFVVLNKLHENDKLYMKLYITDTLSQDNKIDIYTYLYDKNIFKLIFDELELYKTIIINIEQQITNNVEKSKFLKLFFKKLEYNLPIEPIDLKQIILISKIHL